MSKNILLATVSAFALTLSASAAFATINNSGDLANGGSTLNSTANATTSANGSGNQATGGSTANDVTNTTTNTTVSPTFAPSVSSTDTHTVGNIGSNNTHTFSNTENTSTSSTDTTSTSSTVGNIGSNNTHSFSNSTSSTVGNIGSNNTHDVKVTDADLNATVNGSTVTYHGGASNNAFADISGGAFAGASGVNAAVNNTGVGASTQVAQTVSVGSVTVGAR